MNNVTGTWYRWTSGSISSYTERWPSSTVITTERGGGRRLAEPVINQCLQRDHGVTVVVQKLEMRFEYRRRHRHAVGDGGAEAVIAQHGHGNAGGGLQTKSERDNSADRQTPTRRGRSIEGSKAEVS